MSERVKVSMALLPELSEWSEPVQVRVVGSDEDGDLEMEFRRAEVVEAAKDAKERIAQERAANESQLGRLRAGKRRRANLP